MSSHLHNLHPSNQHLEHHHSPVHHLHQQQTNNSTNSSNNNTNSSAEHLNQQEHINMLDQNIVHYSTHHYSTEHGHHNTQDHHHHSPLHHSGNNAHSDEGSPLNSNRGSAENLTTTTTNSNQVTSSGSTSTNLTNTSSTATSSSTSSTTAFTPSTALSAGSNAFIPSQFIGVTAGSANNAAVISGANTIPLNTFYYRTDHWPGSANSSIVSTANAGLQHSPNGTNPLNTVTLNTNVGEILYPNSANQYSPGAPQFNQINQMPGQMNLMAGQQAQFFLLCTSVCGRSI